MEISETDKEGIYFVIIKGHFFSSFSIKAYIVGTQ